MCHFSFSLSHTLTMFLSISLHGLHLLKLKLSLVSLTMAEWLSCFKLKLSLVCFGSLFLPLLPTRPNGLCFFLFFFFSVSHAPKSLYKERHADFGNFPSLLIKISQTFPCMLGFALNQRADFVGLRRQAHK